MIIGPLPFADPAEEIYGLTDSGRKPEYPGSHAVGSFFRPNGPDADRAEVLFNPAVPADKELAG